MNCYKIHSLAEVWVADDVRAHVRESIDFQLGHFKTGQTTASPEVAQIRYESYERFTQKTGTHFHQVRGEAGRVLHALGSRFAIVVNGEGFDVFTDTTEVLVNILLQVVALRRGVTFMHAAGWVDGQGRATLVPGPGGVGKTALLSAGVLRHGMKILGDDLVITGRDRKACSFPRSFVLKPYHRSQFPEHFPETARRRRAWFGPVMQFAQENIPFRGLLRSWLRRSGRLESSSLWLQHGFTGADLFPVRVDALFGRERVAEGGTVARVIYLERHDGGEFVQADISVDSLVARSMAVLQHEWTDYGRWFSQLGALGLFSMADYHRGVEVALREACTTAECRLVQVPAKATPEELEAWFARHLGFAVTR